MSFLTKSKSSLADSPSRLGSKFDTKDRSLVQGSATKPREREDIMGNLQVFREDLRKQISDKISKNFKFLDVSSPKAPSTLTSLLSNKHADTSSPSKPSLFKKEHGTPATTTSSQKKFDLGKEFARRGDRTSPKKQPSGAKTPDLLDYIGKKRATQRMSANLTSSAFLSSAGPTRSPSKATISPSKETKSALDIRPLEYFKKETDKKKSYLERGSSLADKKSDFREDIKNILDAGRSPKLRQNLNASASKFDGERSQTGLSQQLSLLRANRTALITPSAVLGTDNSTTIKQSSVQNLRSTGLSLKEQYGSGSASNLGTYGSVNNYASNREELEGSSRKRGGGGLELKSMNILTPHSTTVITDSFSLIKTETESMRDNKRERLISDALPLSKLYEVQDLFYNVSDKGFDQLTAEYVEELIKLSSVIMHRVKNSSYYNKT